MEPEVVETAAVSVEPRDQLPSVIPCQRQTLAIKGAITDSTLLAGEKREHDRLEVWRGFDDPQPFILTVTPDYVAHETAQPSL
jgi:hypothetical protein